MQEKYETQVRSLGGEDPLEEGMAEEPEEPGGTVHRVTESRT